MTEISARGGHSHHRSSRRVQLRLCGREEMVDLSEVLSRLRRPWELLRGSEADTRPGEWCPPEKACHRAGTEKAEPDQETGHVDDRCESQRRTQDWTGLNWDRCCSRLSARDALRSVRRVPETTCDCHHARSW